MKKYSIIGKDISFSLSTSSNYITEGNAFTVTLKAFGSDAKPGLKVPYRIGAIDGELPYSNWVINNNPIIVGTSVRYYGSKSNAENTYNSYVDFNINNSIIRSFSDSDMQQWQGFVQAVNELTGVTDWVVDTENSVVRYNAGVDLTQPDPSSPFIYTRVGGYATSCFRTDTLQSKSAAYADAVSCYETRKMGSVTSVIDNSQEYYVWFANSLNQSDVDIAMYSPIPNPIYEEGAEPAYKIKTITFQEILKQIVLNTQSDDEMTSLLAEAYIKEVVNSVFKTDELDQFVKLADLIPSLEKNKTAASSQEPNRRRRVRTADYTFGQDENLFVLDNNLTASKTFLARKDPYNEGDESFVLGLLKSPEVTITTIIRNNYVPPPPIPDIPVIPNSKFKLKALQTEITEGDVAYFELTYENVRQGYKSTFSYLDTKDVSESLEDFEIKGNSVIFPVQTQEAELNDSNTRLLRVWLTKYPQITADTRIKVKIPPSIYGRYEPGVYSIIVPPYASIRFTLIGGGGGGAGAINNRTGNWNVNAKGTDGGDTKITSTQYSMTAGGGKGGTDGHAHNGSAYHDGLAGAGGVVDTDSGYGVFTLVSSQVGNAGTNDRHNHTGGVAITTLGDEGFNGSGGNGAIGTRYSSGSGYTYGYGGPGGSGSLVITTFSNVSSQKVTIKLEVGSAGLGWKVNNGTVGNEGADGEPGFAIVEQI